MKAKKIFKLAISLIFTAYLSVSMFICFISGAPVNSEGTLKYVISAAGLSLLLPACLCAGYYYIKYLHAKIDKYENDLNSLHNSTLE